MTYFNARFVYHDEPEAADALAAALKNQPAVNAFCEKLWGRAEVRVDGAVNLLQQLHHHNDDTLARRWLELMNKARLVAYNRNQPKMRILYNPAELVGPAEEAAKAATKGHALSPDAPFGNLMALRDVLRNATASIRWYEQHMTEKVLEALYREIDGAKVSTIRLLSGPYNITTDTKSDFKRYKKDVAKKGITAEWRVLEKKEAQQHHGRFFITDTYSMNMPPVNLILQGTTDEILPSEMKAADFDSMWAKGQDISQFTPPSPPATT
jgi:hypothetical protein